MRPVMEIDRRKVCAMRLDGRHRLRSIIYDDSVTPISEARRAFWVARLSDGAVIVTRR